MNRQREKLTTDAELEVMAASRGVTTLLLPAPNGGYVVYVSPREKDVTRGLMSALVDIKMRQNDTGSATSTVKVNKVQIVTDADHAYYYQMTDNEGKTVCYGYARSEKAANAKMAEYLANMNRPVSRIHDGEK